MENSSRNFLETFISGSSHRPFYLKTHPFEFFDWNHIWHVTFGLDKFSSKTDYVTPQKSLIDDWMRFPVKRSSARPVFLNWIGCHDFLWDEFPSKTVSAISQKFAIKGYQVHFSFRLFSVIFSMKFLFLHRMKTFPWNWPYDPKSTKKSTEDRIFWDIWLK